MFLSLWANTNTQSGKCCTIYSGTNECFCALQLAHMIVVKLSVNYVYLQCGSQAWTRLCFQYLLRDNDSANCC